MRSRDAESAARELSGTRKLNYNTQKNMTEFSFDSFIIFFSQERASEKRHVVREVRAERLSVAREAKKARRDAVSPHSLMKAEEREKDAKGKLDEAKAKKSSVLRGLRLAKDGLGETELLQKEYGALVSRMSSDKKTISKEVKTLYEQLQTVDNLVSELHGVAKTENENRKV